MTSAVDTSRQAEYITSLENYILLPWWKRLFVKFPLPVPQPPKQASNLLDLHKQARANRVKKGVSEAISFMIARVKQGDLEAEHSPNDWRLAGEITSELQNIGLNVTNKTSARISLKFTEEVIELLDKYANK